LARRSGSQTAGMRMAADVTVSLCPAFMRDR
jgi:hypothetical protein